MNDKTANAGTNNYTKYAAYFDGLRAEGKFFYNGAKNGYAWCDVFVDWCFVQAYGYEAEQYMTGQSENSSGAGTAESYGYYNRRKQTGSKPQIGAQVFFKNSSGSISHTGLVYDVYDGRVYTIEGNTSPDNPYQGDMVMCKDYSVSYSQIAGYGYPIYE